MDFITWADAFFPLFVQAHANSGQMRSIGIGESQIVVALYGEPTWTDPGFWNSKLREALLDAVRELEDLGVMEQGSQGFYKPSHLASQLGENGFLPLWRHICATKLRDDQAALLAVIARLTEVHDTDYSYLEWIEHDPVVAAVNWPDGIDSVWPVINELVDMSFVRWVATMGPAFRAHVTYKGLVWLTKRGFTEDAEHIDGLVREWETTSVEFKRELNTSTADEKAEFIKDTLALANTQSSGRRWLIIGFDDKSRLHVASPSAAITQNHLEQLLSAYAAPAVDIRYDAIDYKGTQLGRLEILRDRRKLPYKVAKDIPGMKRQIRVGQIFVRHGSQVEEATPAEVQALLDEGDRARSDS